MQSLQWPRYKKLHCQSTSKASYFPWIPGDRSEPKRWEICLFLRAIFLFSHRFALFFLFLVLCFSASLLFCFSASLLLCFFDFLLFCFSVSLPLCFSASPLFQLLCSCFCFSPLFCLPAFPCYSFVSHTHTVSPESTLNKPKQKTLKQL